MSAQVLPFHRTLARCHRSVESEGAMTAHWAANSPDPIARAARRIIWRRYNGAPSRHTPVPDAEWDAAVQQAREAAEAAP